MVDVEKQALGAMEAANQSTADYGSISSSSISSASFSEMEKDALIESRSEDACAPLEKNLYASFGELELFIEQGPSAWTPREEARVRLKTDLRVTLWAGVMFVSLQLFRINIVNALTTNFLFDIGLQQDYYNLGQTVFLVAFLIFEIPTQILNQTIGPTIWIPTMMTLWGIVGFSQTFITGRTTFLLTRALLGVCQGGFVPGIVLYVTSFYKTNELSVRVSILFVMNYMTNALSALLASAIFNMDGLGGWHNWQWLFFLEGILCIGLGLSSYYIMPSFRAPVMSRFFTEREHNILRARVIIDDPSKAKALENSARAHMQRSGIKDILGALFDPYLIPLFVLGILGYVPGIASNQYQTVMYRNLGYSITVSNLFVVPANVSLTSMMMLVSYIADKYKVRWFSALISMAWCLPFLIILRVLPDSASIQLRTFCIIMVAGFPYYTPIVMAWLSANTNDQHKRALAIAIYNIAVQFGNIMSANVYRASDAPYYRRGNSILIGISVANIVIAIATRMFFGRENKRRQQIWNDMVEFDRIDYTAHTKDIPNRRLDFELKV
ncbi:major facilitator superfamily domain-containing protein [Limtongia smithiae]|uniref:major facilitator superfamily domain-containing protein n=1 Tax=Limtongia smithiae TaxID=1125753 RepID=UPI0034CDC145